MKLYKDQLFEMGFFADFKYWVRSYKNGSRLEVTPTQQWEYFTVEDGNYRSLYNKNIKLKKNYGKSADARRGFHASSPVDIAIRDEFEKYNPNPRVFYLDIETHVGTVSTGFPAPNKALEPISLIQILDSETNKIFIIGDKPFYYSEHYCSRPDTKDENIEFIQCSSEAEMFEKFFELIVRLKPLIVYAWNGEGFDFPYLYNRANRIGLDTNKFSPFYDKFNSDIVKLKEDTFPQYSASLQAAGAFYIDLKRLYQKIVLAPRDSYSLNNIATVELKTEKIEHKEFKTFEDFYHGNYTKPENPTESQMSTLCYKLASEGAPLVEIQKAGYGQFVYYGIKDVVIERDLDKKVGLTKLMVKIAEYMESQLSDALGTTKIWSNSIRNDVYRTNEVVTEVDVDLDKSVVGGYVKEPEPGKHKYVMSADVNSMYPMLAIAGLNMSPETYVWNVPEELQQFVKANLGDVKTSQDESKLLELSLDKRAELSALLKKYNLAMAPNGTFFRKDKLGIIPKKMIEIYKERKAKKRLMIEKEKEYAQASRSAVS